MKIQPLAFASPSPEPKRDPGLWKVAVDLQANFINELMKVSQATVNGGEDSDGGVGEDTFRPMLNEEIAQSMSERMTGRGLARDIYDQLHRSQSRSSLPAPTPTLQIATGLPILPKDKP